MIEAGWAAQLWVDPDTHHNYTILVNECANQFRRYKGFLELSAPIEPPTGVEYEVPDGDKWVQRNDIT